MSWHCSGVYWTTAPKGIGYVGRVLVEINPFDNNAFIIYLICVTIAPALLCTGIYLCLTRIVTIYGTSLSRFKPRTYTIVFCGCDLFSLVLRGREGVLRPQPYRCLGKIPVRISSLSVWFSESFLWFSSRFAAPGLPYGWGRISAGRRFVGIASSLLFKGLLYGMLSLRLAVSQDHLK